MPKQLIQLVGSFHNETRFCIYVVRSPYYVSKRSNVYLQNWNIKFLPPSFIKINPLFYFAKKKKPSVHFYKDNELVAEGKREVGPAQ